MILPPLPHEPELPPSALTSADCIGARASRHKHAREDAISAARETVTLTLEELAALTSSACLTGITTERRRLRNIGLEIPDDDDPGGAHEMEVLSVAVERLCDGEVELPNVQDFARSFRDLNDRATQWIAYVRLFLARPRR